MENEFYNAFDLETREDGGRKGDEYRSPFQIERDRIVFSYPFRRLQSKTQVFQSGEYDFYRTRLTHSFEVAKIGRSICEWLRACSTLLSPTCHIDPDLVEAVGLAHDIGHPPFGHIGERRLNALMKEAGGFEGNAQTLRIVSDLIYERPDGYAGINPTRAFVDGVLKYKALQRERVAESAGAADPYPANHFIYDDQADLRDWTLGGPPPDGTSGSAGLNALKSIECQIMDWADDTAYSVNDIVDGIHARYITEAAVDTWERGQDSLNPVECHALERLRDVIRGAWFERFFGSRIGHFVRSCSLVEREGPLASRTRRHAFDLRIDPAALEECQLYKRIALDLIFRSPQIQQIEFKGGYILDRLFGALAGNYATDRRDRLRLLPEHEESLVLSAPPGTERLRRLCDTLASFTDGQATRLYKRLYDPDFGSIAELV